MDDCLAWLVLTAVLSAVMWGSVGLIMGRNGFKKHEKISWDNGPGYPRENVRKP
jgi:hypothetical protein